MHNRRIWTRRPAAGYSICIKRPLYLHPGRDDAFPTSVLDAMIGGLPVIVSNQTGSIDFIDKLDKNLVCDLDIKDISDKIKYYFDLSTKKKKNLSKRAIKVQTYLRRRKQRLLWRVY